MFDYNEIQCSSIIDTGIGGQNIWMGMQKIYCPEFHTGTVRRVKVVRICHRLMPEFLVARKKQGTQCSSCHFPHSPRKMHTGYNMRRFVYMMYAIHIILSHEKHPILVLRYHTTGQVKALATYNYCLPRHHDVYTDRQLHEESTYEKKCCDAYAVKRVATGVHLPTFRI